MPKYISFGRALTITLPSKWLQARNLQNGDVLHIKEHNNKLIITSLPSSQKLETNLDIRDMDRSMVFHAVYGKYIEGYDIINIIHNNKRLIIDVSNTLIGVILEKNTENHAVIKSIISIPEENFNSILRRSSYIFLEQAKIVVEITEGKLTYEDIKAQEDLLNKSIIYCMRYLNKYENLEHAYKYFLLCSTFELAGDQLSEISKFIGKDKILAKTIFNLIDSYVKCLFSGDFKKIYSSLRQFRNSIKKESYNTGMAIALSENLYNHVGYLIFDN